MADFVASMELRANAQQARAELAATAEAAKKATAAVREIGGAGHAADQALAGAGSKLGATAEAARAVTAAVSEIGEAGQVADAGITKVRAELVTTVEAAKEAGAAVRQIGGAGQDNNGVAALRADLAATAEAAEKTITAVREIGGAGQLADQGIAGLRAELLGASEAAEGATAAVRGIGGAGQVADQGIAELRAELARLKGELASVNAAMEALRRVGPGVDGLNDRLGGTGRSAGQARVDVGNLAAQFNDIGVMLAAGQSPLQLAIQQGTQISQVIGPMGARGAVTALGTSLLSLVNPVSLITVGSIAAGAAMFQWLASSSEEAESVEDALDRITDSVDRYRDALKEAALPMSELREQYGQWAEMAQENIQRDLQSKKRQATAEAGGMINSFAGLGGEDWNAISTEAARELAGSPFGLDDDGIAGSARRQRRALITELVAAYDEAASSADRSASEQAAAWGRVADATTAAGSAIGGISEDENILIQGAIDLQRKWLDIAAAEKDAAQAAAPIDFQTRAVIGMNERRVDLLREVALLEKEAADTAASSGTAGERLGALQDKVEGLNAALSEATFDGEEQVRKALTDVSTRLASAQANVDTLNNADLSVLEAAVEGVNRLLETMAGRFGAVGASMSALDNHFDRNQPIPFATYNSPRYSEAANEGIIALIRAAEGTADAGGFNRTVGSGVLRPEGSDAEARPLTAMTLAEIRDLQRQMLQDPDNRRLYGEPTSALGVGQFVGTTLFGKEFDGQGLFGQLSLDWNQQFTPDLQIRLMEQLLRGREGQGIQGLRSEWEGLKNVDEDTILRALGNSPVPTVDQEVFQADEAAKREAEQALEQARRDAERIREGIRTEEEALAAKKAELDALVGQGALKQSEATAELERYRQELHDNNEEVKAAEEVLRSIETPQETYARRVAELTELHNKGTLGQEAYNRAIADEARVRDAALAAAGDDAAGQVQERLAGEQNRLNESISVGRSMFGGLISDLREGASGAEIFANMLGKVADRLQDMTLDTLFGDGSNPGPLASLFSWLSGSLGGGGGFQGLQLTGASSTYGVQIPPTLLPSAMGNAFTNGRALAFAKGGLPSLSDYSGTVVDQPTLFGLMGEAGREAILPLLGRGVGAIMGGVETTLPLQRLASGKLGVAVEPFALGGVPGIEPAPAAFRAASRGGSSEARSSSIGGSLDMNVHLDPGLRASIVGEAIGVAVQMIEQTFKAYDKNLPRRLRQIGNDPNKVGS